MGLQHKHIYARGPDALHNPLSPKVIPTAGVLTKCIAIALAFMVTVSAVGSPRWRWFKSSAHFSVMYPETWVRKNANYPERLELSSSKGGLEAVVIKQGQANIVVFEETEHPAKTLSDLIDTYTKDATVISRTSVITHG